MIDFDQLQRWRPENQEAFVDASDREIEDLVRFKESGGVSAATCLAPVARRYLFLCADLDTVIAAVRHIAWAKRVAAERVRAAKAEAAVVVAEIEAKGWTFTSEDDEVWVYDPAAIWETDAELRQIEDELTAMSGRLAAPLIEAYDADRELNQQTNAARRATRRFTQPTYRHSRLQLSQRPTHVWSAHRSGHHEVLPTQSRCEDLGGEPDGSA